MLETKLSTLTCYPGARPMLLPDWEWRKGVKELKR